MEPQRTSNGYFCTANKNMFSISFSYRISYEELSINFYAQSIPSLDYSNIGWKKAFENSYDFIQQIMRVGSFLLSLINFEQCRHSTIHARYTISGVP